MIDPAGEGLSVMPADQAHARRAQARAMESAEVTKAEAQYRDEPNGEERCDRCAMFVAGGYCTTVIALPDDLIAPQGWCKHFEAKA